ncbi:hypothetical protein RJ640_002512 [Escallonia rubra]|uniref:Amino acid transporter transmembrane domain-containing protein n=1 Tax=Escallonia rubra TaxID=112253 RepID=A0AA88S9D3_9ASTE|nr:hypothetical protein RJ640_002512 [Escallonia rubra]
MTTVAPNSGGVTPTDEESSSTVTGRAPNKLDAGAMFVLQSRDVIIRFTLRRDCFSTLVHKVLKLCLVCTTGSWLHCGYHLTAAIVAPALLSIPFALALLGWEGGVITLTMAALVTYYAYNLLSLVLEHHAQLGKRQLRFRDMAHDILGMQSIIMDQGGANILWAHFNWAYATELSLPVLSSVDRASRLARACNNTNYLLCFSQFIYLLSRPNGSMQLSHFIVMFGGLTLVMAQMPSFHSLRHINLVSLFLCLAYCACTTAGSIYIGNSKNAPPRDYAITGVGVNRLFGAFNAISIIATTYGNGIIPEIQATVAAPVKGKMFKGLLLCYAVVISTFFSVGISGYWAFGNQALGSVLQNFMVDGSPLVPKWFLLMTNVFTLLQVTATSLVYLQPTNVVLERRFANPKMDQFSMRNVVPRLITRSLSVIVATTIAAMLPFFGDIMALFGAFGCIPLDFILPMVFYNVTFKPSKKSFIFWINTAIAVVSTGLSLVGAVASVRQIILDAKTYRLFANL